MTTISKRILATLCLVTLVAGFASAQNQEGLRTYIKTLFIERIAPSSEGYVVNYRQSNGSIATTYIPLEWFRAAGGKGELMLVDHPSVPYMQVVYQEGKFSLIRLFVSPSFDRPEWTVVPIGVDLSERFNVEEPVLSYQ